MSITIEKLEKLHTDIKLAELALSVSIEQFIREYFNVLSGAVVVRTRRYGPDRTFEIDFSKCSLVTFNSGPPAVWIEGLCIRKDGSKGTSRPGCWHTNVELVPSSAELAA